MRTKEDPSWEPSMPKFLGQSLGTFPLELSLRGRNDTLHTTAFSFSLYVMLCGIPWALFHSDSFPTNPFWASAPTRALSCQIECWLTVEPRSYRPRNNVYRQDSPPPRSLYVMQCYWRFLYGRLTMSSSLRHWLRCYFAQCKQLVENRRSEDPGWRQTSFHHFSLSRPWCGLCAFVQNGVYKLQGN